MKIVIFIITLFVVFPVLAGHKCSEKYYQNNLCYGVTEYRLDDRTRVDCLTRNYAIEFDFAPKWAEAIGQSLHYAKKTGKKPAIYLIVENEKQWHYVELIRELCIDLGITLWVIKGY